VNGRKYNKANRWFLFFGPGNLMFGIFGKSWRVGLGLGPSDPGWDCGKDGETRRKENSSRCKWRNLVAYMLFWPSDWVEITLKPIMMCSLCWTSWMDYAKSWLLLMRVMWFSLGMPWSVILV